MGRLESGKRLGIYPKDRQTDQWQMPILRGARSARGAVPPMKMPNNVIKRKLCILRIFYDKSIENIIFLAATTYNAYSSTSQEPTVHLNSQKALPNFLSNILLSRRFVLPPSQ